MISYTSVSRGPEEGILGGDGVARGLCKVLLKNRLCIFLSSCQYASQQWPDYEIGKYYEVFSDFNSFQKEKASL